MSKLLSANDAGGSNSASGKGVDNADDALDILNDVDDVVDDKTDKDDKDDKNDKKDKDDKETDLDDLELNDEDDKDEKIDLKDDNNLNIDAPPKKKELEKLYPGIFKKVPYLEKMMFRDRQYQELFGGYDDAVEANEKAQLLEGFEKDLGSGNPETLFSKIKEGDAKAFAKLADNLLPTLAKIDKDAYFGVVSDVVKRVISRMVTEGNRVKNEQLQDAALLLNQFVFGTSEFEAPKDRTDKDTKPEDDEERSSWQQERFDTAVSEMSNRVSNTLKNTISEYIDQKNEMSPFVKRHAISEALKSVDGAIASDSGFRKQLDRLWDAANKDRFSKSSLDKIRSVVLGKSKTLLKSAIIKARAEALKGNSRNIDSDDDKSDKSDRSDRKGHVPTGRSASSSKSGKLERKSGESVQDFLMRD